jgi:hypothetical protein
MMAYSNTSISHPDVSIHLVSARVACSVRAGRAQIARWTRMTSACKAMALASALVVGSLVQALAADDPPGPAANKVWGGCRLNAPTVLALENDLEAQGGIGSNKAEVNFVVVYTLKNPNNGQLLSGSSFTGPVICTNRAAVGITAFDKGGAAGGVLLKETTDIPTGTHTGVATINVLSAEEAFILQYELNNTANPLPIEKRFCHTTDANVDCFRIFGAP